MDKPKLTREQRFACSYFNIIEAHFKKEEYLGETRTEEQAVDFIASGLKQYGLDILESETEKIKEERDQYKKLYEMRGKAFDALIKRFNLDVSYAVLDDLKAKPNTEEKPHCLKCGDTGVVEGNLEHPEGLPCDCVKEQPEEKPKECDHSPQLYLPKGSICMDCGAGFNLIPDSKIKEQPREKEEIIYYCKQGDPHCIHPNCTCNTVQPNQSVEEFMKENGLGPEDMINDITYPNGD